MPFDTLTVLLLLVIGNFFVFVFLLMFLLSSRIRNPIITTYAAGKLLFFLAWILLAYRDVIPASLSIILGNTLVFTSIAIEVFCIADPLKPFRRGRLLAYILPTIVFSLVFFGFIKAEDNVRVAVATIHPLGYLLYGSISLILSKRKSAIKVFMGILYFITVLSFVGRFYIAVFNDQLIGLYSNNFIQLFSYILLFFITHFGVIYILISLKEQDEEQIININKLIVDDNLSLKELNISKDKFFSIIAHDLKTPIGALSQLLGLLAEDDKVMDVARRKKLLDTVYTNSKSTYHLLNNLLLWAQSESGEMVYNPVTIDLTLLINENIELFQGSAEVKKITIAGLKRKVTVFADLNMLDSVIRNLLSNAIKFTGEKGNIQFEASESKNNRIEVRIKDTGIGISDKLVSRLFHLDSDHVMRGTNNEKGSGLGLKLCREFVEKNKGEIGVDSKLGKGSEFYFTVLAK